jgi:hypothetical protein
MPCQHALSFVGVAGRIQTTVRQETFSPILLREIVGAVGMPLLIAQSSDLHHHDPGIQLLERPVDIGFLTVLRVLYLAPTDNSITAECGKIVSFPCHEKGTAPWLSIRCFTNSC